MQKIPEKKYIIFTISNYKKFMKDILDRKMTKKII